MSLLIILVSILVLILTFYYLKLKSHFEYFKRKNIPGPPAKLFFGHSLTLWNAPSLTKQIQDWTKQYGSVYGIFDGSKPVYVVSDADFLQEVYIKQFSCFHSRRNNFLNKGFETIGAHLFSASADEWRRQRHIINPTFTALKLKMMIPLMQKCVESMMVRLERMGNNEFNIYELYRRLTMDVIWHCAFGIDTDMQNDVDNTYLKKSLACFAVEAEKTTTVRLSKLFPLLEPVFGKMAKGMIGLSLFIQKLFPSYLNKVDGLAPLWIITHVEDVVRDRLASGTRRSDLLQLMIDAVVEDGNTQKTSDLTSKALNYNEIVMNVFLFMLAGFETTSTFLAYSTSILATHPEVQEKLQQEIDENFSDAQDIFDYDKIAEISYMDLFIREVLRMHRTSGNASTRQCNKTTTVCGHVIEEDATIITDVQSVHYNPELWGPEDPNLFIPERHLVKRHPVAYMPFGVGPRNCVGLRLALIELKMSIARVLFDYNIVAGDRFKEGMKRNEGFLITPQAINIRLLKRVK